MFLFCSFELNETIPVEQNASNKRLSWKDLLPQVNII